MIEYWIDIPNLQTVHLPYSFEEVRTKSITSIDMNIIEWIDVSPILANRVKIKIDRTPRWLLEVVQYQWYIHLFLLTRIWNEIISFRWYMWIIDNHYIWLNTLNRIISHSRWIECSSGIIWFHWILWVLNKWQ